MSSGVYVNDNFTNIRGLIDKAEFQKAYDLLQKISDKCSEWYYLTGLSAMKIGYYDEGNEYIEKAIAMEPDNKEYSTSFDHYLQYRNGYNRRSYDYNYRRRNDLNNGCCCCCSDDCCCCCCEGCEICGDDCCDNLCKLWCLDEMCECTGNDFISCC